MFIFTSFLLFLPFFNSIKEHEEKLENLIYLKKVNDCGFYFSDPNKYTNKEIYKLTIKLTNIFSNSSTQSNISSDSTNSG